MIARFFRAILVRQAARLLPRAAKRRERELVLSMARQIRREAGMPPSSALGG